MFNWKGKKLKRPMLFETDDFVELEKHYCDRLGVIADNGSYTMASDKYKDLRAEITKDFIYDEEVLRFRKQNPDQWLKLSAKVEFKRKKSTQEALEKFEKEKFVVSQSNVVSSQVEIINHDLLTGPTEADDDADELDEE